MTLALAALLAIAVNDAVSIPPGKWAVVPFEVPGGPARIVCEFMLMSGGAGVRAALVTREDADRIDAGRPPRALVSTPFQQKGRFRYDARPARYAVLLDNGLEERFGAEVHIRVQLAALEAPRELTSRRRAVILALSALFFVSVAFYTFRRLWHAMPGRAGQPPPL
jgi:hypothetical protein